MYKKSEGQIKRAGEIDREKGREENMANYKQTMKNTKLLTTTKHESVYFPEYDVEDDDLLRAEANDGRPTRTERQLQG